MKNKKGFTIVELLVSLSLTIVVVIILFEIILLLKDLFQTSSLKTELLNKKSILVEKIYSDINDRLVTRVEQCGDYCLDFFMNDSTTKQFIIDKENLTIGYGDYVIKLDDVYSIGNIYFSNDVTTYVSNEKNNGILNIKIPIYSKLTKDENIGVNIVATYNSGNMAVGALEIKDLTQDNCTDNNFCKDNAYAVGDKIKFGGYNWHIIKNEESSITLLLDSNEIANRSHTAAGDTYYKWSNSYINSYLNGDFYNTLITAGVDELDILTNKIGVCDDASGSGGNPGVLSTDTDLLCNSEYVYSNIRLMSSSEFKSIEAYLNDNSIDKSFLYSSDIGKWALINAKSDSNSIIQINSNGEEETDTYSSLVNVRPIIVIAKK